MPESQQSPEKTPYERSVDEFFRLLRNSTASQTSITVAVAGLLSHATNTTFDRQRYLDRWSERHEFDTDGILVDVNGLPEPDENYVHENDNDLILAKKIELLSDVVSFVVASEHSTLSEPQKSQLFDRAFIFLDHRWPEFSDINLARAMHYKVGEAAAPYIAFDVEQAEMGDCAEARLRRGRFVLRALDNNGFIQNDRHRALNRMLRGARRKSN